jgi:PAS domain-containing protein
MMNEEIDFTDAEMLRKKAEKLLKEKEKKEADDLKELNTNKLLHELQVHQIELEMQNDELRQAYETAEMALKKYTMLFDLSPMGYFSLDSDGTICDLNFTGAELLGERRFSLIDSNFKLFISDDSKKVFNDFFKKVYASNAKESCEVSLGHDNKPAYKVYMEGVVTEDEQMCLLSVVDISKF